MLAYLDGDGSRALKTDPLLAVAVVESGVTFGPAVQCRGPRRFVLANLFDR